MKASIQYAFLSLDLPSRQKIWYCFVTDLVCTGSSDRNLGRTEKENTNKCCLGANNI